MKSLVKSLNEVPHEVPRKGPSYEVPREVPHEVPREVPFGTSSLAVVILAFPMLLYCLSCISSARIGLVGLDFALYCL